VVMEKQYKHLTMVERDNERDKITELRYEGKNISEIAKALRCHKSTISRELKRNSSQGISKYMRKNSVFCDSPLKRGDKGVCKIAAPHPGYRYARFCVSTAACK